MYLSKVTLRSIADWLLDRMHHSKTNYRLDRMRPLAQMCLLLEIFMQNVGRVLTRSLIAEKIWESNYEVDTNLLDVYMSRLRLKLGSSAENVLFKTVRGVGYQLI